jgi:hypothetical protein
VEASQRLQGLTLRLRGVVLRIVPPERDPSTEPSHRESRPPNGNLHRHQKNGRRDHLQTVRQQGKA